MSSTNKTANYELSQFVGTDIPSILNDYNGDMRKIDTAIKAVANAEGSSASDIAGLQATVGQHTTEISGLSSTVNSLSGRVIGIEGKIPASASAENQLITAQEIPEIPDITQLTQDVATLQTTVGTIGGEVDNIQAIVPATASTSNKLATMADVGDAYTLALTFTNADIIRNEGTARNDLNAFLAQNVDDILSHNKNIKVFHVESDTLREVNCAVSHFGQDYMIQIYSPVTCNSSGVKGGQFQYATSEPNSASSYDFSFDSSGALTLRNNVSGEATYSMTYAIYIAG